MVPAFGVRIEIEVQAQIAETIGQFDIFGTAETGIEAARRQNMLAAHRSIAGIELARRRFPAASGHISILFLEHSFFPARPGVEPEARWREQCTNDYRLLILSMQAQVFGDQRWFGDDIIIDKEDDRRGGLADAAIAGSGWPLVRRLLQHTQ